MGYDPNCDSKDEPGLFSPLKPYFFKFSYSAIKDIDFRMLKEAGFKGIVFDKDNTLTGPYQLPIYPGLEVVYDASKLCAFFAHQVFVFALDP
jgi:hypothetical protein